MTRSAILLVVLACTGCDRTEQKLVGTWSRDRAGCTERRTFHREGTFDVDVVCHARADHESGTWRAQKNWVSLAYTSSTIGAAPFSEKWAVQTLGPALLEVQSDRTHAPMTFSRK